MYRLLGVTVLCLLGFTTALSDVNRDCIANNNEDFSNDRLVGTWYRIHGFTLFGSSPSSISCPEEVYRKATAAEITEYKAKYNDPNLPYSLDDNPVIRNDSYWVGMVTGNKVAKFYVLNPSSTSLLADGYSVFGYKPLADNFIMFHECSLRGNTMWLLSTIRNPPDDQVNALISATPELARLFPQKFCVIP